MQFKLSYIGFVLYCIKLFVCLIMTCRFMRVGSVRGACIFFNSTQALGNLISRRMFEMKEHK